MSKGEKFKEIREFLSGKKEEVLIKKKVYYDKVTGQISLRLPKNMVLSKGINKNSEFNIVLNPDEETWEKIQKSNFVIYLEEEEK